MVEITPEQANDLYESAKRLVQKAIDDQVAPHADPSCTWSLERGYPQELVSLNHTLAEIEFQNVLDQ